jgi:ketosteroid isomerase-like protein
MKIAKQFAKRFADEWVYAWNNKDIEAVMSHYADSVVFSSPFILKAQINDTGTIHGKGELRKYFERALEKNPDIHFDLKHIMVGVKSITLIYTRKNTLLAAEAMILDNEGKVVEGLSHYAIDEIYEVL